METMYTVGEEVETTEGIAIIKQLYNDGDMALSFPTYRDPTELFTMSPKDILRKTKKKTNKRRLGHCQESNVRKKIKQTGNYNKDRHNAPSKTEQNDAFVTYLHALGKEMKSLRVIVLDTHMLRTTRTLLAAGILPSHIYIPQPDIKEAKIMSKLYPTLRVYPGIKVGDLIWTLADKKITFDGVMMDYCGMPGYLGQKNTPVDDVTNLFHYNILSKNAVLTQTVCARSCTRTLTKFEGFTRLVKTVHTAVRRNKRKIYKARENIYTDPGSQTMCHFRCVVRSI
jgi:hypothetical protein